MNKHNETEDEVNHLITILHDVQKLKEIEHNEYARKNLDIVIGSIVEKINMALSNKKLNYFNN